ncbi:MAG: KpsF/GutQ family sugar-phosphate isomerase [Planctomycetota bacterium]|nr:MAG: KpsF/GutQ family sugar-phosphate isomerase [Planctomycetota bacterium]
MTSQLRYARDIVRIEGQALLNLSRRLNGNLCLAVTALFDCRSSVIVTGMGKAGLIGQKIAATLASTGTRSHFLHPAEAFHGDLGRIHRDDVVLLLSQSGETDEVTQLLPSLAQLGVTTIAITGKATSTLGHAASIVLELGPLQEACALGLAPSTSTTAMLAVGDALALVTSRMRNFQPADFARFHPGGSLGRQLSRVDDFMRPLDECRVAEENQTVREVLQRRRVAARRSGAIMITDAGGRLTGFFTDSDLARLFESRRNEALDGPIGEVMTADPVTVPVGAMISDALDILAERKISELPVLDPDGKPVGLVDITDLLARGLDVGERRAASSPAAAAAPEADRPTAAPRSSVPRPNFLDEMHGRAAENA